MRTPLNYIERIDQYVLGELDAAEKLAFETELTNSEELQRAYSNHLLIQQAISRKALLQQVELFAPKISGANVFWTKFKWPIILSSFIIVVLSSAYLLLSEKQNSTEQNKIENSTIQKTANISSNKNVSESNEIDFVKDWNAQHKSTPYGLRDSYEMHSVAGLQTWVKPDIQFFTIDPQKSNTIEGKEGTLIIIPANSIVDSEGNRIINGNVTVEIIEALTIDKMIAYNLTTTANGKALTSGGMIYIQAKRNSEDLTFSKDKPVHIEIPCEEFNPEMKGWQGKTDQKGNINWENETAIERFLIPVKFSTLDFVPSKFRSQVQAQLPYKNYQKSSVALEDSFYYSLSYKQNDVSETSPLIVSDKSDSKIPSEKEVTFNEAKKSEIMEFPIKVGQGNGALKITGIPTDQISSAKAELIYGKGTKVTYKIDENGKVSIPIERKGNYRMRILTDNCDPFEMTNVIISPDQITFIEFEGKNCKPTPIKPKTETCYIDPASIQAVREKRFEKTFIATKEFEERLRVLHGIKNAQGLFELYVNNLTKNLHEVDQLVADKLSGKEKVQFETFAKQKLTNVDLKGINTADLINYYNESRKKFQKETDDRRAELKSKTQKELQLLSQKMDELQQSFATNSGSDNAVNGKTNNANALANIPRSRNNVATQNSYKLNWFNSGWVNIDSYIKELNKGEQLLSINSKDKSGNSKIYQCINSLNTVIGLNIQDGKYTAHYPKRSNPISSQFRNTYSVGISKLANGQLMYASSVFDPYTVNAVDLTWEAITEEELLIQLAKLSSNNNLLAKSIRDEKKRIQETLELYEKQEAERIQREKERKEKQDVIIKEQNRILEEEKKHTEFVQKLINSIDPCADGYIPVAFETNKESSVSVSTVIEEATFPGGYAALNQYITSNIIYPKNAIEKGLSGTVYVKIYFDSEGKVVQAIVPNPKPKMFELEQEAIRLVMCMPNWIPAQNLGKNVNTTTAIPINFKLD